MTPRASSQTLTDHDEIRRWAEERGARPACVRNTGRGNDIGMIRLDFPGYSGANSLEEIEWDEWFQKFDGNNLALIVQNETARGERSNFNKLVGRDAVTERAPTGRRTSRTTRRGRTSGSQRTSARGRSSERTKTSARSQSSSRSGTRSSGTRASATSRSKRGTSGRSSRSNSRRGARVTSISSGRSKTTQGRTTSKRTSGRTGQSRRRAA
jgi:hypothetical protein